MMKTIPPQSEDFHVDKIHRETGAAWDLIAGAGYSAEAEQDVAFLRAGGISLLDPERRLLEGLDQWCDCALQLQCSGARDLLSIWNMGAKSIVGIDISETLIGYARQKSDALGAPASWYCCDVLETPRELNGTADLVYTGRVPMHAWTPPGNGIHFAFRSVSNIEHEEAGIIAIIFDHVEAVCGRIDRYPSEGSLSADMPSS